MFIVCGLVRVHTISEDGRDITLFYLVPGDLCSLGSSYIQRRLNFPFFLEAAMDSKVIKISDRALNDLHKMNSCINDYLFQIIVNDFSKTLDKFYKMVCYDVEFRIGTCLNRELKLHGSKEIYLLHEDIAKCINSSRPVVSKTLKKMQDEGMLLLKKGCITITDVDALKALVGEELCCGLPHFGGRTCCCGE